MFQQIALATSIVFDSISQRQNVQAAHAIWPSQRLEDEHRTRPQHSHHIKPACADSVSSTI